MTVMYMGFVNYHYQFILTLQSCFSLISLLNANRRCTWLSKN